MDLLRSLPLGLYLEQPVTWLHQLDARIKMVWLMSFLAAPILANDLWRCLLVALLILLTLSARIPLRVWRQQMGWLLLLGILVFLLTMVTPDGLAITQQPRLPTPEAIVALNPPPESLPPLAQPTGYDYILFHQGPLTVSQQSFTLAIRVSTLLFTLIYATNLFLLTTAPEEITAALEDLMQPLKYLGLPVTEVALTVTLALRFIPLVLEEIQNLVRSVRTRAINWKKLGLRRAVQIWLMVAERLLENLLLRAEQIASAMQVRGFTSPNQHRVAWHQLRLRFWDWIAFAGVVGFWWVRLLWGGEAI
ncbi:energy-coupling factor transporter transmembrane component T family protein [Almyronema epifaneia]|uniref:Energy-coupling factor transporter transmembrane component T family protein n=1 Tax=Almyronema epifaneia S1 TaxID=2991925 RepID=A0ABW6IKI0_9CYAN